MSNQTTTTNVADPQLAPATPTPPSRSFIRRWIGPALWCIGLLIPAVLPGGWLTIMGMFAIYAIAALSQDIVLGRAGMYDMGHAVYFGVGAYVTAILSLSFGWPVLWTFPVAMLVALVVGAVLSAPIVKLRGDYLLVATIGFNSIFILALKNNLFGLTGGPDGLFGIAAPSFFGHAFYSQSAFFYIDWVVLAVVLWIMGNLDRSALGRTYQYIKLDPLAATTLGINVNRYKISAFALSAVIAALAGSLFAIQLSSVSPSSFIFTESVVLFAIVLVGGQGSVPGVLLGTAVMFVLPQVFASFAHYRYFVFGIAMILVMILRPQGIWPARQGGKS